MVKRTDSNLQRLKRHARVRGKISGYPTDTKSTYQGTVGERIERELTVIKNIPKEGSKYGTTYFHILQDKDENIYIWATAAKNWAVGSVHTLRGTVKEHQKFRNELQTVLTRCMEVNK